MSRTEIYRGHWSNILRIIFSNIYSVFIFIAIFFKHIESSKILTCIIVFTLAIISYSILHWRSNYFYIEDNIFIYVKGVFGKSTEQIPLNKITTVDMESDAIGRILGATTLKLNSGNATLDESEFKMSVKSVDAIEIKKLILVQDNKNDDTKIEINKLKEFKATTKDIIIYALTQNKFSWMLILYVVVDKFKDLFKEKIANNIDNYANMTKTFFLYKNKIVLIFNIILIILSIYILATIISIIIELVRYNKFKIFKNKDSLNVQYGLINLKQYSIPIDKIQAIKFKQNIIQQFFNLYKIESVVIGDDKSNSLLFPIVNNKLKNNFITELLPEYSVESPINKPPKRAISRFIIKRTIIILLLSIISISLFDIVFNKISFSISIKYIVILILMISQVVLGYINYLNNGISVEENLVLLTRGTITKVTYIVKKDKIQSLEVQQSIFQKRKELCTYKIDIATNSFGETIEIKNMEVNKFMDIL
ncbi:PH domain-containing protein [Clostridium sp. CTA-5]